MTHSDDDPWKPLQSHLERHDELSQLSPAARETLLSWLQSSCPFQDITDLQLRLKKAKIKGVDKQSRQTFVESLQLGITRRPFLATLGLASAVSLGAGVRGLRRIKDEASDLPSTAIRPLLAKIQQRQQTIGNALDTLLTKDATSQAAPEDDDWRRFLHALDMSNWIEAAQFLGNASFKSQLFNGAKGTSASGLIDALGRLRTTWAYLDSTRSQWQDEYFVAYALGKMPALSPGNATTSAIPGYSETAAAHTEGLYEIAPLFHALEVFNQRFQTPGRTEFGAPIRFTQGHNYSYAHVAQDLQDRILFNPNERRVLINWDAHADLGEPFENPRMPAATPFELLQNASNFAERVVVSSSMSIAGWILPLVYQGLLSAPDQSADLIWVVPKESQQTSRDYMEPYGGYSLTVGDWRLPMSQDQLAQQSTTGLGDWNVPGSLEIRKHSGSSSLRSVVERDLLNNRRECRLHIVDPDDLPQLEPTIEGAQIALSIDADFAGTREPGLTPRKGHLPHYPLTESPEERARHEALIGQLARFVDANGPQIHSVSIANSPNFTVAEDQRMPVAKILSIVADDSKQQPDWIKSEVSRVAPSDATTQTNLLNGALAAGGIGGIATALSLLMRERSRLSEIRTLLMPDEAAQKS